MEPSDRAGYMVDIQEFKGITLGLAAARDTEPK